jgi:hypothetical protein
VDYAFLEDAHDIWSSIVNRFDLPGRAPEPEPELVPERRKWIFKRKLYEIGLLSNGSIYDPRGYGEALVREALDAPPPDAPPPVTRDAYKGWPKAELDKLRSMATTHSLSETAKAMGRTVASVTRAASAHRISFAKPPIWTPERLDRLRSMATTHTIQEAARILGIGFQTTQGACKRHRISFKKGVAA